MNPDQIAEYVRDLVAEAVPGGTSCECFGGDGNPCHYCLFVAEEILDHLHMAGFEVVKRPALIDGQVSE